MSRQERPMGTPTETPVSGGTSQEVRTTTVAHERETVAGPITWEEMRALLRREPVVTERTWRPIAGGLLIIIAGSWNLLLGIGVIVGGSIIPTLLPNFNFTVGGLSPAGNPAAAYFMVIGIISIVAGAFALARRVWPLALAGSITAIFPTPLLMPFILGTLGLIFNVLGHKEFWGPKGVSERTSEQR
jgi:hypothetical protein